MFTCLPRIRLPWSLSRRMQIVILFIVPTLSGGEGAGEKTLDCKCTPYMEKLIGCPFNYFAEYILKINIIKFYKSKKVCKDQELKQSEPNSSPENQNRK